MICSLPILFALSVLPQKPHRIVFSSQNNLYVINLDGTGLKQITKSPAEDLDPSWSPDGSVIVFTRVPGHKKGESRSDGHLWMVRPDGSHLQQLTSGSVYDSFRGWSQPGKRIILSRQDKRTDQFELDLGTRKISRLADEPLMGERSPDSKQIAYTRGDEDVEESRKSELWITASPNQKGHRVTPIGLHVSSLSWSPSGQEIAFKVEGKSGSGTSDQLCILNLTSGKIRTLAKDPHSYLESIRWSPDGKRICFLQANQGIEPMVNASFRQLYVISADGSHRQRLTDHWGDDYCPQWTRDGKTIVVQGERGMKREKEGISGTPTSKIVLVDASGKGERTLKTGGQAFDIVLSP